MSVNGHRDGKPAFALFFQSEHFSFTVSPPSTGFIHLHRVLLYRNTSDRYSSLFSITLLPSLPSSLPPFPSLSQDHSVGCAVAGGEGLGCLGLPVGVEAGGPPEHQHQERKLRPGEGGLPPGTVNHTHSCSLVSQRGVLPDSRVSEPAVLIHPCARGRFSVWCILARSHVCVLQEIVHCAL